MVENILALIDTSLAGIGTYVVFTLYQRCKRLESEIETLKQAVKGQALRLPLNAVSAETTSCLAGTRIALAINQDHNIPTLALQLKDALASLDADVMVISSDQANVIAQSWHDAKDRPDLLIWGSVTCNGYSETYYKVLINYLTPFGPLNPTAESPSHGNPQSSLVLDIVSKLKSEIPLLQNRTQRGRAIQELREEGVIRSMQG